MTIFLRSAALTNFEQVALECQLNPRELILQAGLPYRCLTDPDLRLTAASVASLLETASLLGNEPAFGLRMAASRRLSNLGPLGLLLRDQPTLRHALEALVEYIHTHNEAIAVSLVQSGDLVSIREEAITDGAVGLRQAVEIALTTTYRLISIFLGESWRPRMVTFRHPAPPNLTWHKKVFGCQVMFSQEFNSIVCNALDLEVPNPGADPIMAKYSKQLFDKKRADKSSMSEQVRRLVVVMLPRGNCRVEAVAQHLGVDRRTIANHLALEGLTYKRLVNQMRTELLKSYLKQGELSLSQVATFLGFSELSAFSRWHHQQFGCSASSLFKHKLGE